MALEILWMNVKFLKTIPKNNQTNGLTKIIANTVKKSTYTSIMFNLKSGREDMTIIIKNYV